MKRLSQLAQLVALGAIALLAALPADADVIPISGTATFVDQWTFSLSGPSLSIQGGTLQDSSIFAVCAQGGICNLSGAATNGWNCNVIFCSASLGQTFSYGVGGTLNFVGAIPLAPAVGVNNVSGTAPAIVFGQLFAVDCPSNAVPCDYSSKPLFTVDITGTGTVTGSGLTNFAPGADEIDSVTYSFTGTASVTPEPAAWMLGLTGAGFLLFVWIVRRRRLLREDSFPSNAF